MLVLLAHYINDGHLYTQTFSQYGPFYFYAQGLFFQLLSLPVTHDMGRLVTLAYWAASSLLAAVFVYRLSESIVLACAAGLCSMLVGSVLANEPGHPQQVVLLLYMIAACLSAALILGAIYLRLFLLGCVGAALTFTKVNIGVFYIAGYAQALICLLPSGRLRLIGIALTLIYAATLPWFLMHSNFDYGGYRSYVLSRPFARSLRFLLAFRRSRILVCPCVPIFAGTSLTVGMLLIITATSLQGMSFGSLVWGVILNPSQQASVFSVPLGISRISLLTTLFLTVSVVSLRLSGPRWVESAWFDVLRCATGIASILMLTLHPRIHWIVPLLPLTLIPQSHWKFDAVTLLPRLFITSMAVTQFLGPYPVAGSQVGIAAAPMNIFWAFLCVADGIAGLRANARRLLGLRLDAAIGCTNS